jgi:hypothetical protein
MKPNLGVKVTAIPEMIAIPRLFASIQVPSQSHVLGHGTHDRELIALIIHFISIFSDRALTWENLAFLRQHTRLPTLLKGILTLPPPSKPSSTRWMALLFPITVVASLTAPGPLWTLWLT